MEMTMTTNPCSTLMTSSSYLPLINVGSKASEARTCKHTMKSFLYCVRKKYDLYVLVMNTR